MENAPEKPNGLFWVVAVVFLLWSLMGCAGYLAEHLMSDEAYLEGFGQDMLDLRGETPVWATSAYAVGVWGGLIGAVLVLLRKKLCLPFFYASFAGAVIGFLPSFIDERFRAVMASGDWAMMGLVWAGCLSIIFFARAMAARGVLR